MGYADTSHCHICLQKQTIMVRKVLFGDHDFAGALANDLVVASAVTKYSTYTPCGLFVVEVFYAVFVEETGSLTIKEVPSPSTDSTLIEPFILATVSLTM